MILLGKLTNLQEVKTIIILAKSRVQVNEKEAKIILELLYLVSKSYNKPK